MTQINDDYAAVGPDGQVVATANTMERAKQRAHAAGVPAPVVVRVARKVLDLRTKPIVEALRCDPLDEHTWWVDYQPGNGTAYRFLMRRVVKDTALHKWLFGNDQAGWYVSFMPGNSYQAVAFSDGAYLDHAYIQVRVGCGVSDAFVLAEVFAYLANARENSHVTATSCEEVHAG